MDDGLAGSTNFSEAVSISNIIRNDLLDLGFVIAKSKCELELESVNRPLNIIGEGIQGKSVDWHTDSKNVSKILEVAVESRIYIGLHKKFIRNVLTVTSHLTVFGYQEMYMRIQ